MRVVIDSNAMQTEELRLFLDFDPANMAVITDYSAMEMFKPSSLEALYAQVSIITKYPKQILILKGSKLVSSVDPIGGAVAKRFVDRSQTRAFLHFCEAVEAAQRGHAGYQRQLMLRRGWANDHLDFVLAGVGDMADALADLRLEFTVEELRRYANGKPMPVRMIDTILLTVNGIADNLAARHPLKTQIPRVPHNHSHFIWRAALCYVILLLNMLGKGAVRRKPAKSVNDHVDVYLAAYGTYFNGLMTNDKQATITHMTARIVLHELRSPVPEDYLVPFTDTLKAMVEGDTVPDHLIQGRPPR